MFSFGTEGNVQNTPTNIFGWDFIDYIVVGRAGVKYP